MNKLFITCTALAAVVCAPLANARTQATDSLVQNYMRSSLYTIIFNSDTMNKYYEEETKKGENADALMSVAKSFANTDKKKAAYLDGFYIRNAGCRFPKYRYPKPIQRP